MNGVDFEILALTSVPQLPPSYPMFSSCPLYEKLSFIQQRKEHPSMKGKSFSMK